MDHLFTARAQMGLSLAFHIIFAVIGMGMPVLMVIAEWLYHKKKNPIYLELAKRWSKGVAIMFAVGAVSGTILSFELGLLWPDFMAVAGPVVGMPFSLEGFAFFLEAIFLGIYLYGWQHVSPRWHLFAGVMVGISGICSGIFVVCANAWMNTPAGFDIVDGVATNIDPIKAMLNPSAFTQTFHMSMAAYATIGFSVAGLHAYLLLKKAATELHKKAFLIALGVAVVSTPILVVSADLSAKHVAKSQPAKFAAMEGHWETEANASFTLLGWPNEEAERTDYAIKIPFVLSFLAHGDPSAKVIGLKDIPKENRPPVTVVHVAFQIMIACAMVMGLITALTIYLKLRRRDLTTNKLLLWLSVLCAPLGFLAIEAGWTVTEVGRQPFIIYGIMRTKDAVTNVPFLEVTFSFFILIYIVLSVAVVYLMRRQVFLSFGVDDDKS